MSEGLPAWPLSAAFFVATFVLAVTPGPGVFYIVTRTLARGRRAGLASVAGVAVGNLGSALGASIGLGASFAVSSLAFTLVKYAGAGYLVYLGVRALRASEAEVAMDPMGSAHLGRIFRDGFLVALLNPKTAVFFAAFLPQFMSSESSPTLQSALLGSTFVAIAAMTDTVYALAASAVAPALAQARRGRGLGRYLTGGTFIGLGLFTAASGSRTSK